MSPIDVILVFEDVGNVKRDDDTHRLAESLLVKVFVRSTYDFPFFGWGAAPFITTETKLCQSLIPHAQFVMLNKSVCLFVSMTSTSDGGAFLVKQFAFFTRQLRSNISHTFFQRLAFVWRAHIVVEITYGN